MPPNEVTPEALDRLRRDMVSQELCTERTGNILKAIDTLQGGLNELRGSHYRAQVEQAGFRQQITEGMKLLTQSVSNGKTAAKDDAQDAESEISKTNTRLDTHIRGQWKWVALLLGGLTLILTIYEGIRALIRG